MGIGKWSGMREETEMSMIVEKLLAHDHCSDIFQLPTGKCKGHEADENIFQPLVGKCGTLGIVAVANKR